MGTSNVIFLVKGKFFLFIFFFLLNPVHQPIYGGSEFDSGGCTSHQGKPNLLNGVGIIQEFKDFHNHLNKINLVAFDGFHNDLNKILVVSFLTRLQIIQGRDGKAKRSGCYRVFGRI